MSSTVDAVVTQEPTIHYPESDGQPMAENTRQFRWIVFIKENIETLFADDPNVFVAGDLLWYPVEGRPDITRAPDTMVVFGRPKGDRGSYKQWEEGNLAPQVVFEVRSPSNTFKEMVDKLLFYERYDVEEYYVYDPDPAKRELTGFVREGERLQSIAEMHGWESPRLGIRFDTSEEEPRIYAPDGTPFRSHRELEQQATHERAARQQAEQRATQAEQEREQEYHRAEQAEQRAEELAAKLREMGLEP